MAADIEKLLVQIRADLSDLKKLQVELATVRKQGEETAKGISGAFANAASSAAKIFGAVKLKGVFDSAVADARALEKTILGLQATAKLTGNNFAELNGSVKNLAKDGVLSIDQAAQSMKVLLAQGLSANKAFELVDAAKKVGAFNNIVGNTGQAVQDFIKFLQTGSAELAENLDPSLVKVIKSLGGYEKVANNAAAKQSLINAVIQKGKDLNADYAKFLDSGAQAQVNLDGATTRLSQTFGEKLAPAYNLIQNALAKIIGFIADLVSGFDSTNVAIVAGSALIIVSLQGISGALGLVSASAATAWAAILGPLTIIVAALGAVALAVNTVYQAFKKGEGVRLLEEKKALEDQIAALEKAGKKTQELTDAKEKLKATNKALTEQYDVYLKKLGLENASYETKLALLARIDDAEKRLGGREQLSQASTPELEKGLANLKKELDAFPRKRAELEGTFQYGVFKATGGTTLEDQEQQIRDDIFRIQAEIDSRKKGTPKPATPTGGPAKPEARYIEARAELLKGIQEYERTIAIVDQRERAALARLENPARLRNVLTGKLETNQEYRQRREEFLQSAEFKQQREVIQRQAGLERGDTAAKFNEGFENTLSKLRESQAQFLEEKTTAELEQLNQQFNVEIGNVYRLANAKQISGEEAEKQLQKLRESYANRTAKIYAQSFADTLNAANDIAGGLAGFFNAKDAKGGLGGLGSIATGASKLAPDSLGFLGPIGQGISFAGGIISSLQSLFGESEEERAKKEEKIAREQARRDEEARKILELQAGYQKSMLALQEAAAKLPFENLQRTLRLIDIQAQQKRVAGGDEYQIETTRLADRQAAIQQTLTRESGSISKGQLFSGTGSTPEELIQFLKDRAAQQLAIAQFMGILDAIAAQPSPEVYEELRKQALSYKGLIPDELFNSVVSAGINVPGIGIIGGGEVGYGGSFTKYDKGNLVERRIIADFGKISAARGLASEVTADTSIAENLLSVIEQSYATQLDIANSSKQTAENTKKLEKLDPRKVSFLDLVRNSVFSKGLTVDYSNVQLPNTVSTTVLASTISPAVPSDTLTAMRRLVELGEEANDYLAVIAKNTNNISTDDLDISDNRLVSRINAIKSRSIS